jgi:hypothetical protein
MMLHAGLLAIHTPQSHRGGGWRGALIEGPSGVGKSDFALRALAEGFRLVADDRALVWACDGILYGRAPETLLGLIEARGLGIAREPVLPYCRIVLAVRCEPPERMAQTAFADYAGLSIPVISLLPLEPSAPAKLRRALQHLGGGAEGAYLGGLAAGVSPQPGGDSR